MELMKTLERIVDPSHTALLVVDAQHDFCSCKGAMAKKLMLDMGRIEAAVPRLNVFINNCRDFGIKVIWVRQMLSEDRMLPNQKAFLFDENDQIWYDKAYTPGTDWYEALERPKENEPIITKWSYDAFQDTDLHLLLQCTYIKSLLMTGFVSNVCVETTARHGFLNGYYIVAVSDCTDAFTQSEYDSAMFNIKSFFGHLALSQKIVDIWKKQK
jgi:ureidoacrylate peracid hydrolase